MLLELELELEQELVSRALQAMIWMLARATAEFVQYPRDQLGQSRGTGRGAFRLIEPIFAIKAIFPFLQRRASSPLSQSPSVEAAMTAPKAVPGRPLHHGGGGGSSGGASDR